MELKVKPIVNNLFHATITHQGLQGTAVGHTKDEATKKALEWLKREIEAVDQTSRIKEGFSPDTLKNELDDEQELYAKLLANEAWNDLDVQLNVKPIVNGLFHATVTHKGLQGTAVGHTKDEATEKALEWLRREIEAAGAKGSQKETYSRDFLKDKVWKELDPEVQELAADISKIALKAALKYAIRASIGGLFL
jgi:hypothetical protein